MIGLSLTLMVVSMAGWVLRRIAPSPSLGAVTEARVCAGCGPLVDDVDSCIIEDARSLYGSEPTLDVDHVWPNHCPGCAVFLGGRHHSFCRMATCGHGGAALTCPICALVDPR